MRSPSFAPCPVCASNALDVGRTHHEQQVEYTLLHCGECGVEHWQPLEAPKADFYEASDHALYAGMHAGTRDASIDPRFVAFMAEFGHLRGVSLLDIGCSDGAFLQLFASAGNDVVGIDIDTRSLEVARGRGLEVHEAKIEAFAAKFPDRRFDIITMFDVLEHVTDPLAVVGAAAALLAPGGKLVGTVPNRKRLFVNFIDTDYPPHHFFRFDEASLASALRKAGLDPTDVRGFQWGYAGPFLFSALLKKARRALLRGPRTASPAVGGQGTAERPSLKRRAGRALQRSLGKASEPIETALGRSFKIYFSARPAP